MKLTYLGTAAAEGVPAIFCNCKYCCEARRLGGKSIRTRSQAMINDDLLIDFPADTYMHFLQNGIEGDKIKYLAVTHAHQDHLYADDFLMRQKGFANGIRVPNLKAVGSKYVCDKINGVSNNVEATAISAYETVALGDYRITALPARHMFEIDGAEPFIYVIEGDKTLLYANDTGYFYEGVFDYIEKNKLCFDMISLDCTNIDIPISDEGGHMGFSNIDRVLARLELIGAINEKTKKYVNHFSHNANPIHPVLEQKAQEHGCLVSFDGCEVEL